jgi:putative flippase GtrA
MNNQNNIELSKRENRIQFIKFVLFSMSAGVIQLITFTLMNELMTLPYWPKYLTALILSIIYNFTVNRRFTFKSAANIPLAMTKVFGYYCIFTPLSTWWGEGLNQAGWNEYIILLGTMVTNLITEFLFTKYVVYRNSINTNDLAQPKDLEGETRLKNVE